MKKTWWLLLVMCVGQVALAVPASAHSELVGATPGPESVQDGVVSSISLTFDSELSPKSAAVVVRGPGGRDRVAGRPTALGDRLTVNVDPVRAAGLYEVSYRVVAADGHPIIGTYRFKVTRPEAAPAPRSGTQQGRSDATTDVGSVASVAAPSMSAGPLPGGDVQQGPWWGDSALLFVLLGLVLVVGGSLKVRARAAVVRRAGTREPRADSDG